MFSIRFVLFLFFVSNSEKPFLSSSSSKKVSNIANGAQLGTPELITHYNYNSEVHHVTTEDNYILELHRVSGGPKFPPQKGKKVCFLMHGLKAMSDQWVISGPNEALAFYLADEGYDVWMGNSRGTNYALNHTKYEPFGSDSDQTNFWSFSWHEIGVYDIPAMIDYVLVHTEQQKLQYIGHSQGCGVYFVMMSTRPEYNTKIEMMHAFAPAVFIGSMKVKVLKTLAKYINTLWNLNQFIGFNYFLAFEKDACSDNATTSCEELLYQILGRPSDQLKFELIPNIFATLANQTSINQLMHFGQATAGKFQMFDYGRSGNRKRYGQRNPPAYKFSNAKAPVAVYYGDNDWLVVPKDVKKLIRKLPNVVLDYPVPHTKFNHADFAFGKDARRLVYEQVLKMIKSSQAV